MPIQERYWHLGESVNAEDLRLSPLNRAFRYGDGLFETLLIRHGKPVHFQAHLDRMQEGMRILGLGQDPEAEREQSWESHVQAVVGKLLIDQDETGFGRLRLTVYRSGGGAFLPQDNTPLLFAEIHPLPHDPWMLRPPQHLCFAHEYPLAYTKLSAVKSLNALPQVMAARHAQAEGYDDAIVKNVRGEVAECTAANIFLVLQNRIVTPWLGSGCLPGVMRSRVMTIAQQLGILAQMQPVTLQRLSEASEIFTTNAIQGLQPVGSIAETRYAAKHHPVMSTIRDALLEAVG